MTAARTVSPGLQVRQLAASIMRRVLEDRRTVDEAAEHVIGSTRLEPRDRAFLFNLVLTAFRRKGEIDHALRGFLAKSLPRKSGTAPYILQLAAAQLLFMETPPHAVIDLAVRCAKADRDATHFSGLINAVLRKVAEARTDLASARHPPGINTPSWLWERWKKHYGEAVAAGIASAHMRGPDLDISVKNDPKSWAGELGGLLLPSGTIRLPADHLSVRELPGFTAGAWWVQDTAAAFPVRLLGDLGGKSVLDLCAAPGGKTMQLAAGGAAVTAVDSSEQRLKRVAENLERTGLSAELIRADVLELRPERLFDVVVLDAPCTATGTVRRHPELPYLRSLEDVEELARIQKRLLSAAAGFVAPGGMLLYCTCSLEPEEGELQIRNFLTDQKGFSLTRPDADWLPTGSVSPEGWVRTHPAMACGGASGMDGFFIAVLRRSVAAP